MHESHIVYGNAFILFHNLIKDFFGFLFLFDVLNLKQVTNLLMRYYIFYFCFVLSIWFYKIHFIIHYCDYKNIRLMPEDYVMAPIVCCIGLNFIGCRQSNCLTIIHIHSLTHSITSALTHSFIHSVIHSCKLRRQFVYFSFSLFLFFF